MLIPNFGVDLEALPSPFENYIPGRVLVVDGDGPAYVAAATRKRLDSAISHFQTLILARMFLTRCESVHVHLTKAGGMKNYRDWTRGVKPYQGNRNGKAKPPLLEPLREAMGDARNWDEAMQVTLHSVLEADDGMVMQAESLQHDCVVSSEDKDLRMTRWMWYDLETGRILPACTENDGYVEIGYTPSGTPKLKGRGTLFFWGQMLAGDTADNVAGLTHARGSLCGPVTAEKILRGITCEHTAANVVLDLYRLNNQNPLPEAYCLWLLRREGESVLDYLNSLRLTDTNKGYLYECYHREWFRAPT